MPSSKQAYLPHWRRDSRCYSVSLPLHSPGTYWFILKMKFLVQRGKKKKMGRIRFQRGGTKVMERVQSPIEQLFLSEWWLYYRGDLLKWSLLLLHRIRLSINSAWACQWLSPYVTLQHSACICLLVSATTQGRLPKPRCMCRHAPAPSKTRVQRCCACPETDTSHSHGGCACVSSKTLCFRLRQNQTWHSHAFWGSTTCWGDGKGMQRERFQQFQAMRHADLTVLCVPGTVQGTENCRWHQSQSKGRDQRVNSLWSASLSHPRREPKPGERLCFPETFF